MTYAYRRSIGPQGWAVVDLFASEANRPAPRGYVACSCARFRRAWRLRDAVDHRRLKVVKR